MVTDPMTKGLTGSGQGLVSQMRIHESFDSVDQWEYIHRNNLGSIHHWVKCQSTLLKDIGSRGWFLEDVG